MKSLPRSQPSTPWMIRTGWVLTGLSAANIIADSFGKLLTPPPLLLEELRRLGESEDKLVYVGNSSKTGAYMALMSAEVKQEMEELAHRMGYLELGASEGYERLFTQCLMFGNGNRVSTT